MIFFNKILLTLTCNALLGVSLCANNDYHIKIIPEQATAEQKESIEFAVQRGSLGNERLESSILFALDLTDKAFPGWREYEKAESISEARSISYLDDLQKSATIMLFSARGVDNGTAATWGLAINYDFENPFNGWTVCISVTKGAYSGKTTFAFKPLLPIGQFSLVSYVREFTPSNLILACEEEASLSEDSLDQASCPSYDESEEVANQQT